MSQALDWPYGPYQSRAVNERQMAIQQEFQRLYTQQCNAVEASRSRYYFWLGKDGE